ncbi:hypothetical protein YYG_02547 [Plasmodium vinckei petteri]|uniref:CIR protein PIR protein n=1 Tax=Plasmodium vinckei petteri TaxID=138298 RepID=W7AT84_PLAVN|nr:hypothetical protein YYG_02547 [Plasmodium vinckei petteri]
MDQSTHIAITGNPQEKEKYGLEYDKLAEYAILWLSYKLNIKPNNNFTNLNEFYTRYIVNNNSYNEKINGDDNMTYKNIIDKNKDLMDIKEIYNFSFLFSILFVLYNVNKPKNLNCTNHSSYAKKFADKFKELNKDSNNIKKSSYNKMLSTLSDDYTNLKKIYDNIKSCDFPSLPEIEPQNSSAQNTVVNSGNHFGKPTALSSEVTSSSSSISTTLVPALSTFSVIPVFLGIAYKYSLFGVDKLFQRQYLRKKLKKITKKMKLNI